MRVLIYALLVFVAMHTVSCGAEQKKEQKDTQKKPNIIVMLIDDAGYADFGFAGSKDLKTPNIDKLAKGGVKFSDAHVSASVCGPSRAGLMTGRYQQRFGFECNPSGGFTGIDLNEKTMGDAMKAAGYTTSAFGKWHLGDEPEYRPNARGFDYFWGFLSGSRGYFHNKKNDVPGGSHSIRENDEHRTFEGYLTDRLADKAVEFIDKNKDKPFYMYWAPNAVHTPMQAKEEDMELFKDHPRQKLAAMTWALDRAVGTITNKLKKEGLLDNTIIFFLSDNGGAHNNQSINVPLKGFKGNKFEGGNRVQFLMHWPKQIKANTQFDGLTSALDIFATCVDAGGGKHPGKPLDGVSLIPYLKGEKTGNPHDKLFWRKDKMAASRDAAFKMIRVERLGYRLYDLGKDLGETKDLQQTDSVQFKSMLKDMAKWEEGLQKPLWTEGHKWDTVTWLIHEDLYNNREVQVYSPWDLKKLKKQLKKKSDK